MYLVNVITTTTGPLYEYEQQFAICESCFWCATVFHKQQEQRDANENSNNNNIVQQQICPTCKNKSISLIHLAKDEIYRISMEGKCGLESSKQNM